MNRERSPLRGSMAEVLAALTRKAESRAMAAVLLAVQHEAGDGSVEVSADMHRASIRKANGYTVGVRVTQAKRTNPGSPLKLRFKPPRDLSNFQALYFGGLDSDGRVVVHKRTPNEIGPVKTLTFPCS